MRAIKSTLSGLQLKSKLKQLNHIALNAIRGNIQDFSRLAKENNNL